MPETELERRIETFASDLEAILETVKKELRALESDGEDSDAFMGANIEFFRVSCGRGYHLACAASRGDGVPCDASESQSR